MKKYLLFLIVVAVVVGFVTIAGSQTAWAGRPAAPAAVSEDDKVNKNASHISTVRPGGCDSDVYIDKTVTSVCGIATIVSHNGKNIGTSFIGNRPHGFKNKMVSVFFTGPGGATLCFGAKNGGIIYLYDRGSEKLVPMTTNVEKGIACAKIYDSGDYVLD